MYDMSLPLSLFITSHILSVGDSEYMYNLASCPLSELVIFGRLPVSVLHRPEYWIGLETPWEGLMAGSTRTLPSYAR